ncbi:8247_t:CDS:2, partial [Racocetra persica]
KQALLKLKSRDRYFPDPPSEDEWEQVSMVQDGLKQMSASSYITLNYAIIIIFKIKLHLQKMRSSSSTFICEFANSMQKKFNKYWEDTNILYAIACILDPSYKLEWFRYYYEQKEKLSQEETEKIVINLQTRITSTSPDLDYQSDEDYRQYASKRSRMNTNNLYEIQQYLNEPTISKKIKPLYWWKSNYNRFPNLSKMAKDFLAIPATSVPSEQIFSLAGRIIDDCRINLESNTVEALICQRNWLSKWKM